MKEIIFITSAFPYYPGEQFIETEIMFLAEYFKKVYIVPLDGDDNIQPRPVPANVIILPEVKNFRKRSRHSGLSRFAGITRASRAIMTEACKRRSLFFSHSEAFSLMVRSASLAGQIVPILEDIFRKYDPFLIYSYWLSTGAIAACLALEKTGFDIPLVSRCHRSDLYEEACDPPYCPFQQYLLSKLDAVLPVSEQGRKYLEKKYSVEASTLLRTCRLGVNPGPMAGMSEDGVLRVVSCSSMVPVKRIHILADALKYIDFPVMWTHIGDGPLLGEMVEKANLLIEEKPNVRVNFSGKMTNREVLAYYEAGPVDLFLNVSASEGLPVSIMEAASRGVPIIATDVGGTSEIVNVDEGVGFLLPEGTTPEEVALTLKTFYKLSGSEKGNMKNAALLAWHKNFNAGKNYSEFCLFLDSFSGHAAL